MDAENVSSTNSILELRVYMHCDACERSVRWAIKNIDGVEKVEVDREENKVTVTGDFKPKKVVRRIKKKTGKKAEILVPEEDRHEEDGGGGADVQALHEFQRHGMGQYSYVPYHYHHLVPVPYAYVPNCYDLVPVPPPDNGGGTADVAHGFQRHGGMRPYAYSPYYYDMVHPDDGRGGDVVHEIQRPARSEWDLHCFDDENTQACSVM